MPWARASSVNKMKRILVINPGSTSTKIAVFDDDKQVMAETIRHPLDEVKQYTWVMDQFDYRMAHIEEALKNKGIEKSSLDCVMARGGLLPPVPSGAFVINQEMIDYFYAAKVDVHISNLACVLADAIAKPLGIPAMVYDPVAVDELEDVARITGMSEIKKASRGHVLNSRAMARKCAEEILGKKLEDCTIIVDHIGGGCSTWLVHKGRCIDCYSDDDAGFAPERCGRIQAMNLAKLCYSGKYTEEEMSRYIRGKSGLAALLGTSDALEVERMVERGDEKAKLVFEAMARGHAKGIADLASVVCGKVDRIVITGGLANSRMLMDMIRPHVEWIAPMQVMAGEFEMEALAAGGLRVLNGEEKPHEFHLNGKTNEKTEKKVENMEIILTSENFDREIAGETPILVDFWASWCGPCRMLAPTIEQLAKESDGSYRVGKVNVDDEGDIAARFGIQSIPTLIVFKNGEEVKRSLGVKPKGAILEMLK